MMDGLKRGSAAIVGVAESDLGQVAEGLSVFDLMAQGVRRALDDCGLKLKDVDGLFSATTQSRLSVLGLAEYLGINPPLPRVRPSLAARPSSITWRTRWAPLRSASATSL